MKHKLKLCLSFRCRNLLCCCACGRCCKDEDSAKQTEAELLPTTVVESAKVSHCELILTPFHTNFKKYFNVEK